LAAEKTEILINGIKSISDASNKITQWSLSVFGGSILCLIGSSYIHPADTKVRLIYLCFLFGWIFLGISLFSAKGIMGHVAASTYFVNREEDLIKTFKLCNKRFRIQLLYFNISLLVYAIWLVLYLFWWIFYHKI